MLKGTPVLIGMKNTILTENWTLVGESVNFAKSAVLNDVPPDFVGVVTVSAIQKYDSMQKHRYVKAIVVQYAASQAKEWSHHGCIKLQGKKTDRWHAVVIPSFYS